MKEGTGAGVAGIPILPALQGLQPHRVFLKDCPWGFLAGFFQHSDANGKGWGQEENLHLLLHSL